MCAVEHCVILERFGCDRDGRGYHVDECARERSTDCAVIQKGKGEVR